MGKSQNRASARIALAIATLLGCLGSVVGSPTLAIAQPRQGVVVIGRRPSEDRAADVSVITSDRTPRSGESVPQLLSELPGVTVSRLGGIGSMAMVSLRGSTWEQVGVYLDGIPLNSALGGGVDLSAIPLGDIDRIEVYRGVSPIGFGSSALGGIISITTRAPRTTGFAVARGIGSFATHSGDVSLSWAGSRLRLYAGAHVLTSAGDFLFHSDNGTAFDSKDDRDLRRTNNAAVETNGVVRAVLPLGEKRELVASTLAFLRDQGLPGYATRQTREASLRTLRLIGSLAYDSREDFGPGGHFRAQVYYRFEQQMYRDPLAEISVSPASTRDETRIIGTSLRLSRRVRPWLQLSGVSEGRYEQFEPYDAYASTPRGAPASRLFGGMGLEADVWWAQAKLHVIPSVRLEMVHDMRSGRGPYGQPLTSATPVDNLAPLGRLALVHATTHWLSLRANAARYARFPSTTELYGNTGFILGNPTLLPESGWNGDVGATVRIGRSNLGANVDAALFAAFVDELIQFQQDAYGRSRALNLGRGRILGAEASTDVRLTRYSRIRAQVTFTDGRDVSDTSLGHRAPLLPLRPRFRAYLRPEGRIPIGQNVLVGGYVDVEVTDGNYLDPANLAVLPSRELVGAGLYAEVLHGQVQLIASVYNLGDARIFDFAGFPLSSRSFFLSLRINSAKEPSS